MTAEKEKKEKKKNEVDEGLFGQSGWEKERDRQHAESPEGKKEAEKKAENTTRRILKGLKRYKGGHGRNPWTPDEIEAAKDWLRATVKSAAKDFGRSRGFGSVPATRKEDFKKTYAKEFHGLIDNIWAGVRG